MNHRNGIIDVYLLNKAGVNGSMTLILDVVVSAFSLRIIDFVVSVSTVAFSIGACDDVFSFFGTSIDKNH